MSCSIWTIHQWTGKLECIRLLVSVWGGGLHVPFISTSIREVGVVYDLNIESKIDLAGNAIIKIYVIDY